MENIILWLCKYAVIIYLCVFFFKSHKLYLYFLNIIIIIYNYNIIIYILYLTFYFLFNNNNKKIYNNYVFYFGWTH